MNLSVGAVCNVCGVSEKLLRCKKCKLIYYCTKEHQIQDWKQHKRVCNKDVQKLQAAHSANAEICKNASSDSSNQIVNHLKYTITSQGSSEAEILRSDVVSLNFKSAEEEIAKEKSSSENSCEDKVDNKESEMPISGESVVPSKHSLFRTYLEASFDSECDKSKPVPFLHNRKNICIETQGAAIDEICKNVIRDMDTYGLCVLDNFLGSERGLSVLNEVLGMYSAGVFKDGQLVTNTERRDLKTIRGDKILWVDGKEPACTFIGHLLTQIDNIIVRANKMHNNGKLGDYNINGRTKAMVACYPGSGSHYVKHVDNPNKDGRCITAIYYLNKDWNIDTCGGLLRVFPEGWKDQVANIEPLFDRVLFFWSDRRNPHEVQPAFETRYAITLWYFDALEREEATNRFQREHPKRPSK